MKMIGIISNPSYNGNTAVLAREALKAAAESGAEVEEVFLPHYDIQFCKGCFLCMAEGRCPIPDDFEDIRRKLYDCDGIVIGGPTYGLEPNAIMKNFFDRLGMYTVYTSSLAGKYGVGISTAGGIGASTVAKSSQGSWAAYSVRGYVSGKMGVLRGWDRIEENRDTLWTISPLT